MDLIEIITHPIRILLAGALVAIWLFRVMRNRNKEGPSIGRALFGGAGGIMHPQIPSRSEINEVQGALTPKIIIPEEQS